MSKKETRRRATRPAASSSNSLASALRKPVVQLSIIGIVALIIAAIALVASGGTTTALAREISVEEAHNLYGQPDVVFLDVRQPEEWNEYHAPNSTLIPLGELAARVNELPKDKTIVVVCRSGNRSQEGRDILLKAGFENVTSMAGGLKTWRSLGYPTVSGP